MDSGEQEEPVSKPAASTDSETSDSDDEVPALQARFSCSNVCQGLCRILLYTRAIVFFFSVQWTVGGTKGKKKVKPGKGSEKKNATKKKFNKATASGSSDGDSSAESSAPEEGKWV